MRRMSFFEISLDKTETATLMWLADRGYDGGFGAFCERLGDGTGTLLLDSSDIDSCNGAIMIDEYAFLACNRSSSLAEKLNRFLCHDKTLITSSFTAL